jgi:four helix bundle protein
MSAEEPGNVTLFGFETLDVYQRSVEFLALAWQLGDALPRGQSALADQLRRAALSVPLNIAEGTGRIGEADVSRHRAIARGSAMECAAILDVLRVLSLASPDVLTQGRSLLLRVVSMLSKLCRPR